MIGVSKEKRINRRTNVKKRRVEKTEGGTEKRFKPSSLAGSPDVNRDLMKENPRRKVEKTDGGVEQRFKPSSFVGSPDVNRHLMKENVKCGTEGKAAESLKTSPRSVPGSMEQCVVEDTGGEVEMSLKASSGAIHKVAGSSTDPQPTAAVANKRWKLNVHGVEEFEGSIVEMLEVLEKSRS